MNAYELKPLAVGDILDTAFTVYRRNFGTLITLAIVCLGLPALVSITLNLSGGVLVHPWLALWSVVLAGVGGVLEAGAVVRAVSEAYLGHTPAVGDALGAAFSEFWMIAGAGFLRYLLIFLATLLLFVPGIVVACGYAVVIPVIMLEDTPGSQRVFGVLGRSWRLTKGFKGTAFALGIVMVVIIMVPAMAVGILAAMMPTFAPAIGGLANIVQLAIAPAIACVVTVFYYDLRVRKEAFDLDRLAQDLGMAPEAAGA
ncbi:MAG TPA: hypothetical protein VJ992_12570 [Gemmatimonadales bacterium]|jgi:hypothetical protein|nr:hypothetical protein [Gemmatimonadales bacterium]